MKFIIGRQVRALTAALLLILSSRPLAATDTFVDAMDDPGDWQLGGGSNSTNRTLEADTLIFNEGAASLVLTATYLSPGFAFTDMNLSISPSLDFSQNSFQIDTLNSTPGVSVRWTLGTTSNALFSAFFDPLPDGVWHTTRLEVSDFGAAPQDLLEVNFMQLQVIGDGISPLPATISLHFDNLRSIPEPQSAVWVGLAGLVLALRRRR